MIEPTISGSLLTNGGFESWSVSNVPDGWSEDTGAPGTNFFEETSVVHRGAAALRIAGAATNDILSQTLTGLLSFKPYAVNLFCKCSGTPAAGVLTVELVDGNTVTNDAAGTPNSFTVALTSLGTTYLPKNAVWRLPSTIPPTVKVRLRLSTALSVGTNLYVDTMALAAMTNLYAGGPYISMFEGATNFGGGDTWSVAVADDYAGTWQWMFNRLFGMASLGLQLPITGSTTISASLLT